MVVRKHLERLSLPDGYSAKCVDAVWCLFDPHGTPLLSSADATAVEIDAWRDVWRRRHEDFVNECAMSRAGAGLPDICGRRDAPDAPRNVAERHATAEKRPERTGRIRRQVFTAAAAGAAAGLVIGLAGVEKIHEGATPLATPNQQAGVAAVTVPKPLGSISDKAVDREAPNARTALRSRRVTRPRSKTQYAVSVGNYANAATADRMKHLVRSKGYIVDVVPRGAVSQVATPPYRTRAQAERVARALEEIRLPAHLVARRVM